MEADFEAVKSLINERLEVVDGLEKDAEEQFISVIAERVAELMESNMELFFNHLYRMDVDERKIRKALSLSTQTDESVYITVAKLIYERQKLRIETKRQYKQDHADFFGEE